MPIPDFSKVPLEKLISLKDRVAVITGGARGIGLAIAKRLAEAGAHILIVDIDVGECLKKSVADLKKKKTKIKGLLLDSQNANDMDRAADAALKEFGKIDIWVNNAGIYPSSKLIDLDENTLTKVFDTNIKGVMYGSRAAVSKMKKTGGVILNLASVSGFQGEEDMVHYNATKFAVRGITAGLAKKLGEKNIRVVAIAPTLVDTPGIHEQTPNPKKEIKETAARLPLGRVSVPDDIARIALILVSDLSAFVTGTTFVVDGGDMALG